MIFLDFFILVVCLCEISIRHHVEAHRSCGLEYLRNRLKRDLSDFAEFAEFAEYHSFEDDKSHGERFGYRNTEEWAKTWPACAGNRQSPIDLNSYDMVRLDVPSPLKWQGYRTIPRNMSLGNNGHTVEIGAVWGANETPYISGGPLESDYAFAQLHFHWASRDDLGSEHTINNRSLPLEMHMVHYKKEYGSVTEALKHTDGLAVIGILFEISTIRNLGLSMMGKFMSSVIPSDTIVAIKPFPLSQFNLEFPEEYVVYLGSLTTPPCSEIVTWIIPAIPRLLTGEQIDLFRSIELVGNDEHNFRPTRPRNGRMIYYISS